MSNTTATAAATAATATTYYTSLYDGSPSDGGTPWDEYRQVAIVAVSAHAAGEQALAAGRREDRRGQMIEIGQLHVMVSDRSGLGGLVEEFSE